tara:strand:- start:264 stop:569 length:306 start_codon:yes stop_codon:yes gene_type:complete
MALGDITETTAINLIHVTNTWEIRYQIEYKKVEELENGQLQETYRDVDYILLLPFRSVKNSDNSWTHIDTDISKESSEVQTKANEVWSDDVKNKYKTFIES